MNAVAEYDAVLSIIYAAAEGGSPIGAMLEHMARHLDAAAAGFLVYDDSGLTVTHSLAAPSLDIAADWQRRLGDMNKDPGIRALSRRALREPRRFTDLVPEPRLRNAEWFRRQQAIVGVGYGIAVDLELKGLRVRMFAMRASGRADFGSESLASLGMLARHVERAFAGAAHRLAPRWVSEDVAVQVYRERDFADAMEPDRPLERRLALHYGLTVAEARVAIASAQGLARSETAARLGISLNSLKTHLRRVYAKLGISRSAELVRIIGGESI